MKAAIFHGARNITIEDVPEPKVEPDSVVVKVKACGICGSDLHLYKCGGQNEGTILGHEMTVISLPYASGCFAKMCDTLGLLPAIIFDINFMSISATSLNMLNLDT